MKGYQITQEQITPFGEITLKEAVELTFTALKMFTTQMVENYKKEKTEEEVQALKEELHDVIVISCSIIADEICPEAKNQTSLSPEELLEKLEEAAKK